MQTYRQTAKTLILSRLISAAPEALACHEFKLFGISENSIATRLSEMAKEGIVVGIKRDGKTFKEWRPINVMKQLS